MHQMVDFKTKTLSKDRVYYMSLIFDVAFCRLGQNSCRERTKKNVVFLVSIRWAQVKKTHPHLRPRCRWGETVEMGAAVWGEHRGRERTREREKWGNHYHFSTSLVHLMYPRGNGSNWSLLAADHKQIDSSGGDMRSCLWPTCISKRVCIVNVHSCVTRYGNGIMHLSALNSIFPVCVMQTLCVGFFFSSVCLFPQPWRCPLVGAVESLV